MTTKDKERTRPAEPKAAPRQPRGERAGAAAAAPTRRKPVAPAKTKQDTSAKTRQEAPARKRPAQQPKPQATPDVVYLPPKPFKRHRLILELSIVVAVALAFLLGVSVFFKVDVSKTVVSGCDKYTASMILEASGIQNGDHLLTFNRAQVAGKIIAELPYVDSVRIGIKLPDTVNIEITEVKVPYVIKDQNDQWWLVSASGKVMEQAVAGEQAGYTKILGVQLDRPQPGSQAVALEPTETQTDESGNPIPVVTTQAQRLQVALSIVHDLEKNGIIGGVSSLDVNRLGDIQLWYGQQYQVKFGTEDQLSYKISCMKSAIDKLSNYQSGVLDITFTTWPDKVVFTSFDENESTFLQKYSEN